MDGRIRKAVGWLLMLTVPLGMSYWLYWKQSNRGISYSVASVSSLGPSAATGFTGLQVLHGKDHLDDPYVSTIVIWNSGDIPLQPTDFSGPLHIKARPIAFKSPPGRENDAYKGAKEFFILKLFEFVEARITSTDPAGIPVSVTTDANGVNIAPLLINPGDRITVSLLTAKGRPNFQVEGRIAGVKTIEEEKPSASGHDYLGFLVAVLSLFIAAFLHNADWHIRQNRLGSALLANRLVRLVAWMAAVFVFGLNVIRLYGDKGTWAVFLGSMGAMVGMSLLLAFLESWLRQSGWLEREPSPTPESPKATTN